MHLVYLVTALIKLDVNETTVAVNESVAGNCTGSGNPPPLLKVAISDHRCNLSARLVAIDNFTTKVEFEIPHVSRDSQRIYCFATNHHFSSVEIRTLNIINGNVSLYAKLMKFT